MGEDLISGSETSRKKETDVFEKWHPLFQADSNLE